MKDVKLSQKLTESGLMLALATILSLGKIAELPYGGSITFASMLPMIIIAYRYGFTWGALSGFVYGLIQMVLGLNAVSYATTFFAAVAIILLDYILAFMSTSVGAFFRGMKNPAAAFGSAAVVVCLIRYLFHVISGCTVWAGLSIPTADALLYSLVYNATYMIPETIVTVVAAIYIGSVLDFRSARLSAAKTEHVPMKAHILSAISGFIILGTVAAVVAIVFPTLQNAETGEFDITGITAVNSLAIIIIVAVAAVAVIALQIIRAAVKKQATA